MVVGKLLSLSFLFIGVFILVQVISPLVFFKLWEIGQKSTNQLLISPTVATNSKILGISIKSQDNFPSFVSTLKRETAPSYTSFSLSVPSLKIVDSEVWVDSNDLSKKLAHLPGSALPGEKGNIFISGHSALSWIFKNQTAIFQRLMEIKKGDQILVSASGTNFTYQVIEIKVVNPTDLSVINPPDERNRYITLMTCVPPGLNTKRLVVLGKMI